MIDGKLAGMVGGAGLAVGLLCGWGLWHPRGRVVETPAAEIRNKDSSLTLERKPDAAAKPSSIVPKGTLERIARLTVRPDPVIVHDTAWIPAPTVPHETSAAPPPSTPVVRVDTVQAPDIQVELALVRLKDGTRRVTASAKGATIVGGIDIPVETATPERVLRWSAGATYTPVDKTYGGFVTRDLGPVRILGAIDQAGASGRWQGKVGLALRW